MRLNNWNTTHASFLCSLMPFLAWEKICSWSKIQGIWVGILQYFTFEFWFNSEKQHLTKWHYIWQADLLPICAGVNSNAYACPPMGSTYFRSLISHLQCSNFRYSPWLSYCQAHLDPCYAGHAPFLFSLLLTKHHWITFTILTNEMLDLNVMHSFLAISLAKHILNCFTFHYSQDAWLFLITYRSLKIN
jgi:hypothetical protein